MVVLNAKFPLVRLYVVTSGGTDYHVWSDDFDAAMDIVADHLGLDSVDDLDGAEIPQSDPLYRAMIAQASQQ